MHRMLANRRGAIAMVFAVSLVPIITAVGAAVDYSRMTAGRSALQRAVDNAALSGAAAYVLYTQGDTYNAIAIAMARSAFCNATTALPSTMLVNASTGSKACGSLQGAGVTAVIGGYNTGTRGQVANSGCSSTTTVVAGAQCGFIVSVSTTATLNTSLPLMFGATRTISVTASAINPFINLASALTPSLKGTARYANSLWVYPLLLDANGNPDFSTNTGALPDTSACTGAPDQTSCGAYSMIASTRYSACTTSAPCSVNGTIFGGTGGIVQNPAAGQAIITATTPIGIAFASTAGGSLTAVNMTSTGSNYGYYKVNGNVATAPNGCVWPFYTVYNTVNQIYDATGKALMVDSSGNWLLPTHWFYSSYLANKRPPSQALIDAQTNTAINPKTGLAYNIQDAPAVPRADSGTNVPATCVNPSLPTNHRYTTTTYPITGNTNCSLYISRDPSSTDPDPSLKTVYGQTPKCFDPTNTPGQQYAALSCQSFGGHNFVFFWNDMGGQTFDDSDYANGTLQVGCAASAAVILIN